MKTFTLKHHSTLGVHENASCPNSWRILRNVWFKKQGKEWACILLKYGFNVVRPQALVNVRHQNPTSAKVTTKASSAGCLDMLRRTHVNLFVTKTWFFVVLNVLYVVLLPREFTSGTCGGIVPQREIEPLTSVVTFAEVRNINRTSTSACGRTVNVP